MKKVQMHCSQDCGHPGPRVVGICQRLNDTTFQKTSAQLKPWGNSLFRIVRSGSPVGLPPHVGSFSVGSDFERLFPMR
jgi:hypothetical protein